MGEHRVFAGDRVGPGRPARSGPGCALTACRAAGAALLLLGLAAVGDAHAQGRPGTGDGAEPDGLYLGYLRAVARVTRFVENTRDYLVGLGDPKKYYGFPERGDPVDVKREFQFRFFGPIGVDVKEMERAHAASPSWPAGERQKLLHRKLYPSFMTLYQRLWDIRIIETSILVYRRVVEPHGRKLTELAEEYREKLGALEERRKALRELAFCREVATLNEITREQEISLFNNSAQLYRDIMEGPKIPGRLEEHRELQPIPDKVGFFVVEEEIRARMVAQLEAAKAEVYVSDFIELLVSKIAEIEKLTTTRALDFYGFGLLILGRIGYSHPFGCDYTEIPLPPWPDHRAWRAGRPPAVAAGDGASPPARPSAPRPERQEVQAMVPWSW